MDRRTTLQWMLAATALPGLALPMGAAHAADAAERRNGLPALPPPAGYGTDPDLVRIYRAGDLWPLSFTDAQRAQARLLCSLIIPADERSPSAGELGVQTFIDEWISAPYPAHRADRTLTLWGLAWLDDEARRRFGLAFDAAGDVRQRAICDDICLATRAAPEFAEAARFFARFRDLTAGGFYTTPDGMRDLRFVGNTPSVTFDGPPPEVLKIVGVT